MEKRIISFDILATNRSGIEEKIRFHEDTSEYVEALNNSIVGTFPANFAKLAIRLWPRGFFVSSGFEIPRFEYDEDSDVAVINVEYGLDEYFRVSEEEAKNQAINDVVTKSLVGLPEEFGLDEVRLIAHIKSFGATR